MLTERLQILVTKEQRRRLESEAERTGSSIGAVIRDAIDGRLGAITRADRLKAVAEIGKLQGRFRSPQELNALIDQEREEQIDQVG